MIAYNNEWLNNLLVQEVADNAADDNYITATERDTIHAKYPARFYTQNIFIRIGLFILTLIIAGFSFGLITLLFLSAIENTIVGLSIFFSILTYAALEFMVRKKNHRRSGVDDALLWCSACSLFAAIVFPHNLGSFTNCLVLFLIALYCCIRFANGLMAVVTYIAMMGMLFFAFTALGSAAKAFIPFILMAASLIVYFIVKKLQAQPSMIHYQTCLDMVSIAALISFYAAGNYYIVRELSNSMFNLDLKPTDSIPLGWLFWILTVAIPLVYLARGIQKKNTILIRVGLLLIAAIVFTIRYYHSILPVEIIMTIGGLLLIIIGYALLKYLHESKFGFTSKELSTKNAMDKLNIESLIIAQTFAAGTGSPETKFGGGSFGGGGSSGDY